MAEPKQRISDSAHTLPKAPNDADRARPHRALDHRVADHIIAALHAMLGGQGVYRGSSVLVTGLAGTGKSSIAAKVAETAGRRGERTLLFAYEESAEQLLRNTRSIGLDILLGLELREAGT